MVASPCNHAPMCKDGPYSRLAPAIHGSTPPQDACRDSIYFRSFLSGIMMRGLSSNLVFYT